MRSRRFIDNVDAEGTIIPFHSIEFSPTHSIKYAVNIHAVSSLSTPTIYRLSAGFCVPAFGFRGSFRNSSAGEEDG